MAGRHEFGSGADGGEALEFGGEGQPAVDCGDVKRLDSERIARRQEIAAVQIDQNEGEHAAQALQPRLALAGEQRKQHLGVGLGLEGVIGEGAAQIAVIIDFTVEDQPQPAGVIAKRQSNALGPDDGQAVHADADVAGLDDSALVRSAMAEGPEQAGEDRGIGNADGRRDAAHYGLAPSDIYDARAMGSSQPSTPRSALKPTRTKVPARGWAPPSTPKPTMPPPSVMVAELAQFQMARPAKVR